MALIHVLLALMVAGVLLWLISAYLPGRPAVKAILKIAVLLAIALWLLRASGLVTGAGQPVGRWDPAAESSTAFAA